jgi:hypothetical protein
MARAIQEGRHGLVWLVDKSGKSRQMMQQLLSFLSKQKAFSLANK